MKEVFKNTVKSAPPSLQCKVNFFGGGTNCDNEGSKKVLKILFIVIFYVCTFF